MQIPAFQGLRGILRLLMLLNDFYQQGLYINIITIRINEKVVFDSNFSYSGLFASS